MVEATLGSRQCKGFAVLAAMRRERAAPADGNVDEIENGLVAMQEDLRVSVLMLYLTGNLGCYYLNRRAAYFKANRTSLNILVISKVIRKNPA